MSLQTAIRASLFVVGAICYALLGTLSQLSKSPDGSYGYSMPSVIFVAEIVKLCLSVCFLSQEVGVRGAFRQILFSPFSSWIAFAVPSVLYSINNNLDMLNNQYMDPATEQVLVQLKVLTTGLVWWLVFKQSLGVRQWFSLVLLFFGAALAAYPTGDASGKRKTMYIEPIGFAFVFLYVWISAGAGVYNEWLYKGSRKDDSIHICNIRLYAIGSAFNLFGYAMNASSDRAFLGIFDGYNQYTWGLVATYSCMGLLIAQVMKYFSNIAKLFMSAASMYVQTFFAWAIFGYAPEPLFLFALLTVTIAILLYNLEKLSWSKKNE